MGRFQVEAEDVIGARPEAVWDILTDYRAGHPRILPKAFSPLEIEAGGKGAGTIIRFTTRVGGMTRAFRGVVSTPEPGRVLVETYAEADSVTTFFLTPLEDGARTRVRIVTEMAGRGGPGGAVERVVTRLLLRPVYRDELRRLDAVAREWSGGVEG